jgi:hypothetical protein
MSEIAIIRITEVEGGSVNTLADAFSKTASEAGHMVHDLTTVLSKTCHCGANCIQKGGSGCGDEDCLCRFAESVPGYDCLVFVFPVDRGFSPTALNRTVHKLTFNCGESDPKPSKKVFVIAISENFSEYVFTDAISVISMECTLRNWDYAGELLVPGLPDLCLGADPMSRRKAKELASKI